MSNEDPAFDESLFQWETKTSSGGASFRIGWKKSATDSVIEMAEAADGGTIKAAGGLIEAAGGTTKAAGGPIEAADGGPIEAADGGTIKVLPHVKQNFGMTVHWPVQGRWIDTSKSERETSAISKYKLQKGGGLFFDYTLQFVCSQPYDYDFYDETGDSYGVNVYRVGQHNVQYKSKKPDINYVTGS